MRLSSFWKILNLEYFFALVPVSLSVLQSSQRHHHPWHLVKFPPAANLCVTVCAFRSEHPISVGEATIYCMEAGGCNNTGEYYKRTALSNRRQ